MSNEKYLIALDMDGTLLNSKKKISFLTRHYLKKLARNGHKIILASGRPSRSLKPYHKLLKLDTPMICYNGAYVFDPNDPNFKPRIFAFPKEIVKELTTKLEKYTANIMCEDDVNIWVDKEDKYLAKFFWYDNMDIIFGDLRKTLNKDPMTMIVQMRKEDEEAKKDIVNICSKYEGLSARFWTGSPYFELYFVETSKGASILDIASYYQIPQKNIIVFGDAENDVEMINIAGYGVAMINGKTSVKEKAPIISLKSNDKDGIYHTLKKILKGEYISKNRFI